MKHTNKMIGLVLGLFLLSVALFVWHAEAQTICDSSNTICVNSISIHMFRDSRGDNDVGGAPGEQLQFGANVVVGLPGVTLGASYPLDLTPGVPPTTKPQFLQCNPGPANPTFCARSTPFDPNQLGRWTLIFKKGSAELRVPGPPLLGINNDSILQPFPHPTDVTIAGSGTTPTISWIIPGKLSPDGFRVNVYRKKDQSGVHQPPDIIHTEDIMDPTTVSYQLIPQPFPDSHLSLEDMGFYTISFQLVETRNHVQFNRNADILRRSTSFFAFNPLPGSAPPNVYLPTISGGSFHFQVGKVGPDSRTFIDPPVAVGYDYATGQGDPNFKSVLLPEVGDNVFDLYLWNGSEYRYHVSVGSGFNYTFPPGVDRFRVLGIETGAGLDPKNATAFITGLTFVSSGQFTGTMTPIVASDVIATEIKPGDGPNCVNPKSKGVVPFAILGGEVDVTTINRSTLQVDDDIDMGTGGVAPAKTSISDVNGDGINDLVMHFNTQDLNAAGLLSDRRTLYLTARLLDGTLLVGSDVIFMSNGPTCQ